MTCSQTPVNTLQDMQAEQIFQALLSAGQNATKIAVSNCCSGGLIRPQRVDAAVSTAFAVTSCAGNSNVAPAANEFGGLAI